MIKKSTNIVSIFINFLFVVGVILMVVGFVGGLRFTAYTYIFDEYPLGAYEDCSYMTRPYIAADSKDADSENEIYQKELDRCEESLKGRRKIAQVNEAVQAVGLLISGIVLVWLFNPKGILTSSYK